MIQPIYTFIIPHYNSPELLNRCINSIPQRSDIEILVVDDNSDYDQKPQITRSDTRVIEIENHVKRGAGHARNVGIEHALGKWLFFADCDDFYSVGFLDVLDRYSTSSYDVIFFNCEYVESDTMQVLKPLYISKIIEDFDGSEKSMMPIRYMNNTPWSKMISREFVIKYHLRYEETINGNDFLFSVLLGSVVDKYIVLKDKLYVYTRNRNSLSNFKKQSNEALLCRLLYIAKRKQLYKFLSIKGPETSFVIHFLYLMKNYGFITFLRVLRLFVTNGCLIFDERNAYIDRINETKELFHH